MSVKEFDPRKRNARRVRRILGKTVRSHLLGQGDDLAGFAIVSWDHRGAVQTGSLTSSGPIDRSLLPAFVGDALNRHIAVSLAQENTVEIVPDDEA